MALEALRRMGQRVRRGGRATRREGVEQPRVWDDPNRCPFCGDAIADGGPAFMDHIERSTPCSDDFTVWRINVAEDIGAEWGG